MAIKEWGNKKLLTLKMPHIHEKIDFTVDVFVIHKNKVLLRKHDKYKKWLGVGGHIELDEDPIQAAIRETKEEVGLDVEIIGKTLPIKNQSKINKELIAPRFVNRHKINDTHEHVTFIYFAKSKTNKLKLSEKEVSEECRWFTKEELEKSKDIQENIKAYALEALKLS